MCPSKCLIRLSVLMMEQVLNRGVHASDIAILGPTPEPSGDLLRARLAALPWPEEQEPPTFSERDISLVERADGARLERDSCVARGSPARGARSAPADPAIE